MNPRKSAELERSSREAPLPDLRDISAADYSYSENEKEISSPNRWVSQGWILWGQRTLLTKVVFRTLLVVTGTVFLLPSRFESTARIMPPEHNSSGLLLSLLAGSKGGGGGAEGASPGLASLAGSFLGGSSPGAMFVDLASSRTVEDHIIDRFDLQKVYSARYKQDARKKLEKRTAVEENRKSGVISITVTDNSPERARDIAQAYVEELDSLLNVVSTSSARRERVFIEQRLVTVKRDLEDAEKEFSGFSSKNGTLDIKEQGKAMVQSLAVLQGQLIAAQSELEGLEQIYTGNNIRVRSLKARVGELRSQLNRLGGTDASLTSSALSPGEMFPSIRKLPLLGVQWADLYRRAKIQETVYELLNQQYELARIEEAKEIPTIRVIDGANLPEKKSWPPRLLLILAVTLFSFCFTVVYIVARSHWRKGDPTTAERLFLHEVTTSLSRRTRSILSWLPAKLGRDRSKDSDSQN